MNATTAVSDFGRIDHPLSEFAVATFSGFFSTQRLLQIIAVLGATVMMKLFG
jgi:hypothetical protein